MTEGKQMELFDDIFGVIESAEPPVFEAHTTCAHCEHITAVAFQRGNMFFCSIQRGGKYGRKIKKNAPNCPSFMAARRELKAWDGYYGGYEKLVKRGDESVKRPLGSRGIGSLSGNHEFLEEAGE